MLLLLGAFRGLHNVSLFEFLGLIRYQRGEETREETRKHQSPRKLEYLPFRPSVNFLLSVFCFSFIFSLVLCQYTSQERSMGPEEN